MRSFLPHLTRAAATLALLLIVSVPALGQPVSESKAGNAWIAFVVMIFLVILVAIGAFMSPRRGHQD